MGFIHPYERPNSYIGRTLPRSRAMRAVAGRGRYTDDITLPRTLHAAFVRSPYAHAKILNIETAAAKAADGVKLVMTGAELAEMCTGPWVGTLTVFDKMKAEPQYPMAVDRACWHGEAVVMVVAETRAQAEDAGELVMIDYEELPVVIRKEKAILPDSPVIHPNLGDNIAWEKTLGTGDVDKAFAEADHVLEETFEFGRHTAVSLEPRIVLADYDPGTEHLTIHTSSQCPHMIETVFARTLGVPEHKVRIIAPDVGGSFGLKIHTFGDEVAATAAAIKLARPVKFVADRLESFVSDIHARENRVHAKIGVMNDGTLVAAEIDDLSGVGAYSQFPRTSVFEANQILHITFGPYKHKNYRAKATVAYLNAVPTSQYRAVGHPIGITVAEHMMDWAADVTGLDPFDIRRKNVMEDDSYPQIIGSGLPMKDLSHQACLEKLHGLMNYEELRAEQAEFRKKGIYRGIGLASFIKGTAPSPVGFYGAGGARIAAQDATTVKLEPAGGVIVALGVTDQGQGVDTVMEQIAAAAIGCSMDMVRAISGDTDATPYGGGTYASRATAIGGEATYQAALDLRREILHMAGILLQTDAEELDIVDGNVVDFGSTEARIPLSEIGRIGHFQLGELPNDYQPVLSHTRRYRLQDSPYIYTNGIHGAYVEVDVDTGWIKHLKHWVVEDCGRIINPQLADEQIRGGCVQGLGGALYEHCIYDDAGQLQNGTMADYVTPMAYEMPDIEVGHVETPTSESELGAKGAGESGTGAAPGVMMNAVNDAIKGLTSGRVTEQPIAPEVVLKALGKI
ncbi:MAG: xanthine dehydrogenase family protein molybdopterin-binding subunit [Alphaproteobacteria bacterium]|nr:xanthine dehydrogenase family protein molybdopterin-binding subunit [Alphaproteobacteria bacterium]